MNTLLLHFVVGLIAGLIVFEAGRRFGWYQSKQVRPAVVIGAVPSSQPRPAELVPDPSGARAGYQNLIRIPMTEVTETEARGYIADGSRLVYGHPFDPFQLSHFDVNGFQQWATEGFRMEAVRFYIGPPARLGPHVFRGSAFDMNFRGCTVMGCGRGMNDELHNFPAPGVKSKRLE